MNESIKLPFLLPLQFNKKDFTIMDAGRRVICPCIIYKSDSYHLNQQRRAGDEIVRAINEKYGYLEKKNGSWWLPASVKKFKKDEKVNAI